MKKLFLIVVFAFAIQSAWASYILIPMDDKQANHLKAYGIAYWVLQNEIEVDWLLNYQGGSFMFKYYTKFENELVIRGVSYEVISDAQSSSILTDIASPSSNTDVMRLDKFPKIAVYSPKSKQPWDDAVTLVLTYAEIPYDVIFDDEVLGGDLPQYDWLHLHHEDFTGQYGKFYKNYRNMPWYINQQREFEESAAKHGFKKVSHLKLAVVKEFQQYVAGGGFLFAMCSATDTYDIALAGEGVDMIDRMYDGDAPDPRAQQKLQFDKTFAFQDFILSKDPYQYEYSNIDNQPMDRASAEAAFSCSIFSHWSG